MGRFLSLDVGQKRTGVAVTDKLQLIANGLTTVDTHKLFDFLRDYLEKEDVDVIVVGLPRQMNNELSESMKYIKPIVNRLKKVYPNLSIEYFDERFSSKMAFQTMIDGGLTKKKRQNKALVDEISATIILQGYMESLRMRNI